MAHKRSDGKARLSALDKLNTDIVVLEGQLTEADDRAKRNAGVEPASKRDLATRFPAMRGRR
ncbi:hypothetical protein [Pseudonocardia sp. WMMC193]|uniref:hypothetical protein n=1 Tax=Pseudonocardia sp. WMMC193 TaxID=2911965 RepID=UPI001F3D3123|nr:hypothetical protein [Pseudonocardia sp. WMMC193]MCF7552213.1 hypothetical protein [Pseudonocardia sp. WMMC193]